MGGLRTTPDTKKHTICKQGLGFTYACSNMCGKNGVIQVGGNIMKMRILLLPL